MRATSATLSFLLIASSTLAESAPQPAVTVIRVEITGLRNDAGQVGCLLFDAADGFPGSPDKAVQRLLVKIKDRAATCEFAGVKPGEYAIVSMHDENANGKLDRRAFGRPTEGTGASRDARPGFMSGPRFDDAVLRFAPGTSTISIAIHYP